MHPLTKKINDIQKKHNLRMDNLNAFIKRHYPDVYEELHSLTSALDKFKTVKKGKLQDISIQERIFCIENGLIDRPFCTVCGKEYVSRFIINENRYSSWCSISCSCKDKNTVQKSKKTRLQRYGNANYNGTEKAKSTRLARYDGHFHSSDFLSKLRKTKLQRYGSENFVNSECAKATKKSRYGTSGYNNHEKTKQTKLAKYGDENWNNREKFKDTMSSKTREEKQNSNAKRKKTNLDIYGVEHVMQCTSIRKKAAATNIKKYGSSTILVTSSVRDKITKAKREKAWKTISNDSECIPCFSRDEFIMSYSPDKKLRWKCKKCGHEFEARYDNGMHLPCDRCYPRTAQGTSAMEQEVLKFLKDVCNAKTMWKQLENRRLLGDREIDILVPDKKIAIEFDGLYYHSGKPSNYHLDKTERCSRLGWRLIHIFEDEWTTKKKIVKSRLKHIFLTSQRKIMARKCIVEDISTARKDQFLEKYHIQGKDVSSVRKGLFYKNHLVAVMTFVKSRFSKKHQYELSRYATVANFTIVGGASKLLTAFEREFHPKSLITYADRRWSQGDVYPRIGFSFVHNSQPAYWYVKDGIRYSRVMFQKHHLKDKLGSIFDPDKTETENMAAAGYQTIYDCGNMVFEKIY